jgi:hypothetical protein
MKTFPAFYGTEQFSITFIKSATSPCPRPDEANLYSHHASLKYILIVLIHLRLGLVNGLFPQKFSSKMFYTFVSRTYTAHTILSCLTALVTFHN